MKENISKVPGLKNTTLCSFCDNCSYMVVNRRQIMYKENMEYSCTKIPNNEFGGEVYNCSLFKDISLKKGFSSLVKKVLNLIDYEKQVEFLRDNTDISETDIPGFIGLCFKYEPSFSKYSEDL